MSREEPREREAKEIRELLLDTLDEKGDRAEAVYCRYYPAVLHKAPKTDDMGECSADKLPRGELRSLTCHSDDYVYELVLTEEGRRIQVRPRAPDEG